VGAEITLGSEAFGKAVVTLNVCPVGGTPTIGSSTGIRPGRAGTGRSLAPAVAPEGAP
jgi:hypothetical protein